MIRSGSLDNGSVFKSVYRREVDNTRTAHNNVIRSVRDSLHYVQRLALLHRLPVHGERVTTVCWNHNGKYLLSGSDDKTIVLTNPHEQNVILKYKTAHKQRIVCARFMASYNDRSIITCSLDGSIIHTYLLAPTQRYGATHLINITTPNAIPMYKCRRGASKKFMCHKTGVSYVHILPDVPSTFLSAGMDATVRLFDLRVTSSCNKSVCKENILINSPTAVNVLALAPINSQYLAVGGTDGVVRIYDRRFLKTTNTNQDNCVAQAGSTAALKAYPSPAAYCKSRITSLQFSQSETELLVNYLSQPLLLFDMRSGSARPRRLEGSAEVAELHMSTPLANAQCMQGTSTIDSCIGTLKRKNSSSSAVGSSSNERANNPDYMLMKYLGNCNHSAWIRDAIFWGDNYVMCGSDCGHIFVWNKNNGQLVKLLEHDEHGCSVSCLRSHPDMPLLASAGNDGNIKVWAPVATKSEFDREQTAMVIKNNTDVTKESTFINLIRSLRHLQNTQKVISLGNFNMPQ